MGQPRFEFDFYPASQNQKFTVANFTIELWVDNLCVVRSVGWSLRESKNNNLYPQSPQYDSKKPRKDDPSKSQWKDYVLFFPTPWGEQGYTEQNKAFQAQCVQAFHDWHNAGRPNKRDSRNAGAAQPQRAMNYNQNQGGASLQPRIPAAQVSPVGPNLPQGWTSNLDRQTGRRYFTDPQGNVYLEGDPRLTAAISGTPKPAAVSANDPFASFGSVPGR